MVLNYDNIKYSGPLIDKEGIAYVFIRSENLRWADASDETFFSCFKLSKSGEIENKTTSTKIKKSELEDLLIPQSPRRI